MEIPRLVQLFEPIGGAAQRSVGFRAIAGLGNVRPIGHVSAPNEMQKYGQK